MERTRFSVFFLLLLVINSSGFPGWRINSLWETRLSNKAIPQGPHYESLATSSKHILNPETSQNAQDIQPVGIAVVSQKDEEIQGTTNLPYVCIH
ncbi:hypothetical protein PCANC_09950 [Puccinia coronata f. sp. avenae]|uniref:Uncharacterized protein n=1 Tax=Puccinia coronata f. sp. avenae TaxID=200324 RepID=A0A2N5SY27_9BASI|nr:hypothetical protein PCANC_21353 [Puccinia coronata f. sp. avenae]PLW18146.1 hypothetical protein PCASD_19068 [Puccinia coronata f. sp. avenae]PLW41848.1 hypothetical protein PCASD_05522 [Puccinia coronata f. sp. avenae]PLW44321.1 hypothetical protein PCANC_09950 [Puccinia coronata f. sp. avenae]